MTKLTNPNGTPFRNDIDRLRAKIDIVDYIIKQGVALQPKGQAYVGACPFCAAAEPNFAASSKQWLFHCFACKASGDVFTFIQKRHACSFKDALALAHGFYAFSEVKS